MFFSLSFANHDISIFSNVENLVQILEDAIRSGQLAGISPKLDTNWWKQVNPPPPVPPLISLFFPLFPSFSLSRFTLIYISS
jgi:hypothetical protein